MNKQAKAQGLRGKAVEVVARSYLVPASDGSTYLVSVRPGSSDGPLWVCGCRYGEFSTEPCSHVLAVISRVVAESVYAPREQVRSRIERALHVLPQPTDAPTEAELREVDALPTSSCPICDRFEGCECETFPWECR